MTALIKVREYDSDTKTYHDWYLCAPDCDNFKEAGAYVDNHFGDEAVLVQVDFIDTALYVDAEVFENLRNDYYFNNSCSERVEYEDSF